MRLYLDHYCYMVSWISGGQMQHVEPTHSAARWLDPAIGFAVSVVLCT